MVEPAKRLETSLNLCLRNAIFTVSKRVLRIGIMNLNEHEYAVPRNLPIDKLTILTLEQIKHLAPIDIKLGKFLEENHSGETEVYLNQLFQGAPEKLPHKSSGSLLSKITRMSQR